MDGQLPPEVIRERMERLRESAERLSRRFRERSLGTVRPVLWESQRAGDGGPLWHGYTDNYIAVYAPGDALGNRVTRAELRGLYHDGVHAILPEDSL
jgi:tRNA A37 methylthiotransferase MiaB